MVSGMTTMNTLEAEAALHGKGGIWFFFLQWGSSEPLDYQNAFGGCWAHAMWRNHMETTEGCSSDGPVNSWARANVTASHEHGIWVHVLASVLSYFIHAAGVQRHYCKQVHIPTKIVIMHRAYLSCTNIFLNIQNKNYPMDRL